MRDAFRGDVHNGKRDKYDLRVPPTRKFALLVTPVESIQRGKLALLSLSQQALITLKKLNKC